MVFMLTTIPSLRKRSRSRGFTLAELLVATALSSIILAGVFSAVLMIGRSSYRLGHYIEMEKEARTALETLAVDARVSKTITWHRASETALPTGVTLVSPASVSIRYDYDSADGTLKRTEDGKTRTLVSGIQSLSFTAYQYAEGPGIQPIDPTKTSTTNLNNLTKMLQVSLSSIRSRTTLADATNNVVSARYVLRNKIQTN